MARCSANAVLMFADAVLMFRLQSVNSTAAVTCNVDLARLVLSKGENLGPLSSSCSGVICSAIQGEDGVGDSRGPKDSGWWKRSGSHSTGRRETHGLR